MGVAQVVGETAVMAESETAQETAGAELEAVRAMAVLEALVETAESHRQQPG